MERSKFNVINVEVMRSRKVMRSREVIRISSKRFEYDIKIATSAVYK